jgi:hypothetical protein
MTKCQLGAWRLGQGDRIGTQQSKEQKWGLKPGSNVPECGNIVEAGRDGFSELGGSETQLRLGSGEEKVFEEGD